MAGRGSSSFTKRLKERSRQEKQREKFEKRAQRKQEKQASPTEPDELAVDFQSVADQLALPGASTDE